MALHRNIWRLLVVLWIGMLPFAQAVKIRLASYNVLFGVGAPGTVEYEAVKSVIQRVRPDIIGFQELLSSDYDNWVTLAAELGYPHLAFGPSFGPLTGTQRLGFFSKFPIRSSAEVTEFPGAVELTRYPLRIEVQVPGALNPFAVYVVHFKAMGDTTSQFRRGIEGRRTLSNLLAYIQSNPLNTEYAILGDFNQDVKESQVASFSAIPTGLPTSYVLGSDVMFPVPYALFPFDRFAPAALEPVNATQEDSAVDSTYGTGGRLDYILLSADIRENPAGVPVGEIYNSTRDDGTGGLPKFGSPLPSTTSATASDHLMLFSDFHLIDLLACYNPAIFLSEIVDHPTTAGANYIELYNSGVSALSLTNYALVINLDDTTPVTIPLNGSIGPGSAYVIAGNSNNFVTAYARTANLINTNLARINGNDVIYLRNPDNQVTDAYGTIGQIASSNDFAVAWAYANANAFRIAGISDPHPEWASNEWTIVGGAGSATPGVHIACNQSSVFAVGPILEPLAPRHTNNVSVSVTLNANLPASNLAATAFYRLNSNVWSTAGMALSNGAWITTSSLVIAPNQGDTLHYYVRYTYEGTNNASPGYTSTNSYTFPIITPGGGATNASSNIYFNEIRPGGSNEFIELVAPAGVNLGGYYLRHINGATNTTSGDWTFTFSSFVVPDDGITDTNGNRLGFVLLSLNPDNIPGSDFDFGTTPIQNGPDGLILYNASNNILDAIAWEGPGDLLVDPGTVSTSVPPETANYLHVMPDSESTTNSLNAPNNILGNTGTWLITSATPGALNANQISGGLITGIPAPPKDTDLDGFLDEADNCPNAFNPIQTDTDLDGLGDACDPDLDGDGIPNATDNCAYISNTNQLDTDLDGLGDACDTDLDNDGFENEMDNCPTIANPDQADMDNDGIGNVCDDDRDGDTIPNTADNCPDLANLTQTDLDNDSIGDLCDPDRDGDTVPNLFDNCPDIANPTQLDSNGDGIGNACTADADLDGAPDDTDNCPATPNASQTDSDKDGLGDACDTCFGRAAATNVLLESFTATTIPAGWTVTSNLNNRAVWRFDNPRARTNATGGASNMAIADSQNFSSTSMDTDLRTPALHLGTALQVHLEFKTDFLWISTGSNEICDVDISLRGSAGPWSNIWRKSGASYRGPATELLDLTSRAAGQTNVMIRFRFYGARNDRFWQIDDVTVKSFLCDPNYDGDGDGDRDIDDNCPQTANADQADLDNDGIGNVCDPDRDGDGIPNDWETRFGLNPDNANDGNGDLDIDGKSNREEYVADTVPTNSVSALVIEGIITNGNIEINFDASTNRQYQILYKEGSLTNAWNYDGYPFRGIAQSLSVAPASAAPANTSSSRFYRIMVIPPQ